MAKNPQIQKKYDEELRVFAITLHFSSPKAYDYVHDTFVKCLPALKTLYYRHSMEDQVLAQKHYMPSKVVQLVLKDISKNTKFSNYYKYIQRIN